MKNLHLLSISLVLTIFSCEAPQQQTADEVAMQEEQLYQSVLGMDYDLLRGDGIYVPPELHGNIKHVTISGGFYVELTDDYTYIGYDDSLGVYRAGVTETFHCNCVDDGRCKPAFTPSGKGICSPATEDPCNWNPGSCEKIISSPSLINKGVGMRFNSGIIDLSQGISIETRRGVLPQAFPSMYEIASIRDSLNQFKIQNEIQVYNPKDTSQVPILVNVYGRSEVFAVESDNPILYTSGRISIKNIYCYCGSGTSGDHSEPFACEKNTSPNGSITCDNPCSDGKCTMSAAIVGEEPIFTVNYLF